MAGFYFLFYTRDVTFKRKQWSILQWIEVIEKRNVLFGIGRNMVSIATAILHLS